MKAGELRRHRKQEADKLQGEYKEVFLEMKNYISLDVLRGADLERALLEVAEELLKAQAKRKKVESFMGKNLREYCDSVIEKHTCGGSFYYRLASRAELVIAFAAGALAACYAVSNLFYKTNFYMDASLFIYCLLINIAFIVFIPIIGSYQRKRAFERYSGKIGKPGRSLLMALGIFYISYLGLSYGIKKISVVTYGTKFGPLAVLVMAAAMIGFFVILKKYKDISRLKYEDTQRLLQNVQNNTAKK